MKRNRTILHPAARAGFVTAAVAIALLLTGAVAFADTYTVDRTDDVGTANACTAAPNDCSLRGAIHAANAHPGADVVQLAGADYYLTVLNSAVHEDTNVKGDLDVLASGGDLRIEGDWTGNTVIHGARATSGLVGGIDRVLHIDPSATGGISVTLSLLTIQDGYGGEHGGGILLEGNNLLTVQTSKVLSNTVTVVKSAAGGGGGIAVLDNADVLLYATDVMTNTTQATVVGPTSGGGGIYNQGSGQILITESRVSGNRATVISATGLAAGGGIYNIGGTLQIIHTDLEENTATGGTFGSNGEGGGIYNGYGGAGVIEARSMIAGNVADVSGGGIHNLASGLVISDSLVSGNAVSGGQDNVNCQGGGISSIGASNLSISNSTFQHNLALVPPAATNECWGGAIVNDGSSATISYGFFSQNQATTGCGAIYDFNGATLVMSDSQLTFNTAGVTGGAMCNGQSTASITNALYGWNISNGDGGGMSNGASFVTVERSAFVFNSAMAGFGGGVWHVVGKLTVTDTSFDQNYSTTGGGGIWFVGGEAHVDTSTFGLNSTGSAVARVGSPASAAHQGTGLGAEPLSMPAPLATDAAGGGLLVWSSTASITNTTFSGNQAADSGGGLYASTSSVVKLVHVTVTENRADHFNLGLGDGGGLAADATSTLFLKNSIVSGNIDTGGEAPDCAGTISTAGDNLIRDPTGCTLGGAGTNLTGIDPLLATLNDNGGWAFTHALLVHSPAVDGATDCTDTVGNPVTTDQRHSPRPVRAACDLGAFELKQYWLYLPVSLRAFGP